MATLYQRTGKTPGLRCPSEVLLLRWTDINWEKGRFYVTSPKTEHHHGKEGRIVPLFPELKTELEALFFDPESEGKEFVVNRYRRPDQNLGTTFVKIVKRAGLPAIPRPFDNMRASCSTDVYSEYGEYLESQWIGHTAKVAKDHYLQVRDADFERATGMGFDSGQAGSSGKFSHPFSHLQRGESE